MVSGSEGPGVRLADVLERAKGMPSAVDVVLRCADGYTDSIPAETAFDEATLLAITQNRRPLVQEHGFPCRLRVPRVHGMKNVKWLQMVEVVGRTTRVTGWIAVGPTSRSCEHSRGSTCRATKWQLRSRRG